MKPLSSIAKLRQVAYDSAVSRAASKESLAIPRFLPSPLAVVALLLVLIAIAAMSLTKLAYFTPAEQAIIEDGSAQIRERLQTESSAHSDATDLSSNSSATASQTLFVQVTGAVKNPSVVQLKPGSRAMQAVEAAGGLTPDAAIESINLATLVEDGSHIHVLTSLELDQGKGGISSTLDSTRSGCIDLAVADSEDLQGLPGVGVALAGRIIAYRNEYGISNPEDVRAVSGIGPKTFEGFKDQLCQ